MKNYTHNYKHFYGVEITPKEIENGYINYRTLAKSFEGVLCNDITKLFYSTINGEYNEVEQVNGYIDNSEEIEELKEQIEILESSISEAGNLEEDAQIEEQIEELEEQIEELEREQDEQPEIYQYFIIDNNGAEILQDSTNEIVYYLPALDVYVWGVTHWGTSWDYVYTDIKIELDGEQ